MANPDRPTHRVGDHILRRWLAQGGMAELYLAQSVDPARQGEVVVLKRVLPQLARSQQFLRMFSREARLAAMLDHPNIVRVHDLGALGGDDCYFTMEYVHGVDLDELLDTVRSRGGAIPLAHALTIAVAMCAGLHHAHEARGPGGQPLGVVHRDVSPSNVLLGYDGQIKVTDFGVAKALAMTRLTQEGTRKGKLSYMSPEQASGETVDRRADVFAIATVLYELTTMERLFGGENDLAVMYNILHRPRPRPREVSPGYPAALEAIVMRAVAPELEARHPDAQAFGRDLEGFAAGVGLELSPEALAAFVRQTIPPSVHPRDDPSFASSVVSLTTARHTEVTLADEKPESTEADARWPVPPTGPQPPIGVVAMEHPPGGTAISANRLGVAHPSAPQGVPAASASWPTNPAAPPRASSSLQTWSLALAAVALFAAGLVGALLWRLSDDEPAAGSPGPVEPPATAAQPATLPDPVPAAPTPAAPTPARPVVQEAEVPLAATPAAAPVAKPRSGKRRSRKRKAKGAASASPATDPSPAPDKPASKKPPPTDTLLPIVE